MAKILIGKTRLHHHMAHGRHHGKHIHNGTNLEHLKNMLKHMEITATGLVKKKKHKIHI